MRLLKGSRMKLKTVTGHKLRSLPATLGNFLGVATVIGTMC